MAKVKYYDKHGSLSKEEAKETREYIKQQKALQKARDARGKYEFAQWKKRNPGR